ncbi:MAG: GPW/gp25 family protein [Actinomycetales bacterium]|nr:GPW/gp25 family protein [Actinomycetales bacterium]
MSGELIGSGWCFPAGVTGGGGIRLVTGLAEIDAAIRLILSTSPGERVMRPDFGCAMWEQVFAPMDANTLGLIERAVLEALQRWEPRIEVERVHATAHPEDGLVSIEISYVARATNDTRNLVYPFYVIPREDPAP